MMRVAVMMNYDDNMCISWCGGIRIDLIDGS